MVQVIQAGPTEASLRQRAFDQSMQGFAQGLSGLGQAIDRGQQQQQTARQNALQMAQQIAQSGQEVTPEMMGQIEQATGYDPSKRYGLDAFKSAPAGPPAADAMLGAYNQQAQQITGQRQAKSRREKAAEKRAQDAETRAQQAHEMKMRESEFKMQPGQQQAKLKGEQFKAAGFAKRAQQAEQALSQLPSGTGTQWYGNVEQMLPDFAKGEERKLFEQTKNNFISAVLRRESGAAISDDEYSREEAKYFPQPGDTQAVLAQKAAARQQAIQNLSAEGGGAMQAIAGVPLPEAGPGQAVAEAPGLQPLGLPDSGMSPRDMSGVDNFFAVDAMANPEILLSPERTQQRQSMLQMLRAKKAQGGQ